MRGRLPAIAIALATLTVLAIATPTLATAHGPGAEAATVPARGIASTTTVGPHAGEDDSIAKALGVCSAGSEYDVGLGRETGIDLEFGLETGIAGQAWSVRMKYDGHVLVETQVTTDEDGGFELRHVEANLPGKDTLHVVAMNTSTRERCDGSIQAEV